MTAIVKKIKVGLSQEEIDDLKPFDGTYDGDINANGFISIQNKNITFGGAKSNSVEVSFKNGSRNGNSSEELAFLSDLVGSDVAQSVIDLGVITEDPASATNSVLSEILSTGIYKFEYEYTSAPGITSQAYLMYVFNKYGALCQNIICSGNQFIQRIYRGDEGWLIEEGSFATDSDMVRASKQTTATNTSDKIFLIGSKSQYSIGTSTYSHDTVYVDTDGHLYDSGNRVLTTADSVGGGTVSGDYLPHHTVTLTDNITPMSTVLSAYGSGLYAITFNGPASGTYIFNVQHQGDTRYGMSAIDINTNATSYYVSKDMSTVTAADFKNSFTSFLKTTGGTITGDLSVAGNLKLNNTRKIVHGNDLYEYTFPKKSGTVALLSDVETNGSGITLIPVTEHISGDTYIYNSDFNFNNLTQENWKNYALQMSHHNGQSLEILKPDKYDSSVNGENFYFENSNIGLKVTTSSIYTTTITSYKTPARIILQESYSGSTYKYTSDFDWTKLTPDMFNKYYIEFVGYEGVYREILKANRFLKSDASSQYWYENDNVGIKITPSASERFIVEKYEPEASITSKSASKLVANNHITQSGLSATYPTINKSGVYLINVNWGGEAETQVVMWLVIDNPDILFSSPFSVNFKNQTYNQLRWANNSLTLVDQSGNSVNITNTTITAKLIREY